MSELLEAIRTATPLEPNQQRALEHYTEQAALASGKQRHSFTLSRYGQDSEVQLAVYPPWEREFSGLTVFTVDTGCARIQMYATPVQLRDMASAMLRCAEALEARQ